MRIALGVLVIVGATLTVALGADDPPKKDPEKAAVHKLPVNYSKLGLTDAQKKKIYAIEDEIDPNIAKLKKDLEDLQAEKHKRTHDVLTDEQKKALVALRDAKDGGETKPPDTTKPADKPKDDKPKDDKKP